METKGTIRYEVNENELQFIEINIEDKKQINIIDKEYMYSMDKIVSLALEEDLLESDCEIEYHAIICGWRIIVVYV